MVTPPSRQSSAAPALAGWRGYLVTLLAVGAAALLRWRLGSVVGNTVPLTLFYPAIALATWLGGVGAGLFAVAVGGIVGSTLFINRAPPGSADWLAESVRLALFVFVGVLLSLLVEVARREGRRADTSARAAREAEQKWRSLVENTDDSITIADRHGRIEFMNRAPGGPRADRAPGATLFDDVDPDQHSVIEAALGQVFGSGEAAQFEVEARRPDGTAGWHESRLVPIRGEGGVSGALVISSDVTARRQSEESLRENAARFRALFESSLDATVVADDEGRFVEVNPAACALFGLPAEGLLGHGIWEFSGNRAAFDAAWARFLAEGEMRGEWDLRGAGGSEALEVEFSARARFLPGRHLSVLRDISGRRRAQRASEFLSRAARALAASLEERATASAVASVAVPDLADWCAVDAEDELGQVHRLALTGTDLRREEAAWALARAYPPDGLGGVVLAEVMNTGQAWMCAELDGPSRPALAGGEEHAQALRASGLRSMMAVPLASRGRTIGALWFGAGETRAPFGPHELALARDLAERAGVALENARLYQNAQQANRVKDEFLATLSHELRTPLNAIVGWTHLLRAGELDGATSQRALETIERNARLQSQLIADILDVSRIVSGKLRIESASVDLGQVVVAAADAVRPAADARGVRLGAPDLAPGTLVLGDAGRLQQVVQNLLHNAVKFTSRGGEVRVELRRAGHSAELQVRDTGVGIAAEFLPHVFERFRQWDSSTTRPHGGLGLGLAITRHLVEAHGGSVEAASDGAGKGATFSVRLPMLAEGRRDGEPPALSSTAPVELAGVRVLVVDDHADGRNALGTILERLGASVARAATSREAFASIEEFQPHVLVSDLGLPDEDGFALVARVRSLPPEHGGAIPAVAVTGHTHADEMARALTAGFQKHLAKPIDPMELASVVAQLARGPVPARLLD
jgi:PAS domain S-box-containing protein